jgi:CRP-like cAMP-binding protein
MSSPTESPFPRDNRILSALPPPELVRLKPHFEPVRLPQGTTLYAAGDAVKHVYFLSKGMASLLALTEDGAATEVGMVGNEGMVGIPTVLRANTSPYQVVIQLPASALRMRGDLLRAEFDRGGQLQDLLLRYTQVLLTQISQSAACNRFHTVEERLCRWLLTSRDRSHMNTLYLTQEFLSQMIGAPRTSVTMTARTLQRAGLIRYSRGKIQIVDQRGLRDASCDCYKVVAEEISHLFAA